MIRLRISHNINVFKVMQIGFAFLVGFLNVIINVGFATAEQPVQAKDQMTVKDLLKTHALEVNDILTSYIQLHDDALKESGTFDSLFLHVDFEKLYKRSTDIHSQLNAKKEELDGFYKQSYSQANSECRMYFDALHLFVEKLLKTAALLEQRQLFLYKKSKGEEGAFSEFMKIEKEYQNSINDYMEAGKKLNQLNSLLF